MRDTSLRTACAIVVALAAVSCGRDDVRDAPVAAPPARLASGDSAAGRGAIRGRVVYDGEPPERAKLLVIKDRDVCRVIEHRDPSLIVGEGGGIANVVVSVDGLASASAYDAGPYVLDQRDCVYDPHVMLVAAGAPLDILNSDGVLHNVHTFCEMNRASNVAQPPALKRMTMTFERPERVQLRCDVHGWMGAWVVVVDHPYHVVSGDDGAFVIEDVPAGDTTLRSWHETLGEQTTRVSVPSGGEAVVELGYPSRGAAEDAG